MALVHNVSTSCLRVIAVTGSPVTCQRRDMDNFTALEFIMTSEWLAPPTRTEIIENLVSGVGKLHKSVGGFLHMSSTQIDTTLPMSASSRTICTTSSGQNSTTVLLIWLSSNCTLVISLYTCCLDHPICKRYQFNGELYNPDVVINILIKALTACPLPDFNLCLSLLDDRLNNTQLDEPDPLPAILPVLKTLHNLLYRCRFPAFWQKYRSEELDHLRENYTVEISGFENAIRAVALRAVRATFTRINAERLGSYLDLAGMMVLSLKV